MGLGAAVYPVPSLPPSDLHAEPGQHPVEGQPPLRRPHGRLLQRRRPAGVSAHPSRSREIASESQNRVHPPGGTVLSRARAPGGRGKDDAEGGSRLLLRCRCSFHEGVPDEVSVDARGGIPGEGGKDIIMITGIITIMLGITGMVLYNISQQRTYPN